MRIAAYSNNSNVFPDFVISTEAKRSGEIHLIRPFGFAQGDFVGFLHFIHFAHSGRMTGVRFFRSDTNLWLFFKSY